MIFEKIENKFSQWNQWFRNKLIFMCPPGYEITGEYRFFWGWLFVSTVYSGKFIWAYTNAYRFLFVWEGKQWVLDVGRKIPPFFQLVGDSMMCFLLGILFLGMVFFLHYNYYRKDSKSIYLMKRLQDSKILIKSYLGTPIVYGSIFLVSGICLLIFYYGIYRFITPGECLR